MQLASLINSTVPQRADEVAGAMRAWAKGQVLDARVLRAGNGQALLQVNGQQVLAQSRMPLTVGQTLRLQVDKAGTQPQLRVLGASEPGQGSGQGSGNRPVNSPVNGPTHGHGAPRGALLQILNQSAPQARPAAASLAQNSAVPVASNEALAAAVLRSALPQRQSLPQSMSVLAEFVATPRPAQAHPALEQARAMASDLLQGLPRPEDAGDANRLRAMVQRSGLFYEAELEQQRRDLQQSAAQPARQHVLNPPAADMKARLLAVAESLASALRGGAETDQRSEQAAAALRGAVSNIETNQVASVRGSEQNTGNNAQAAVWRVDLPFADARGHQALQLRIDREPRGGSDDAAAPSWIAQLSIEPPGQAPLHARIALNAGTVYTTFTTDDQAFLQRIGHGEAELRQLLDAVHLALGGMSCQRARVSGVSEDFPAAALVSEHV